MWAAVEDAARLRDAVGVQPPPGTPHAFLEAGPDPLGEVVSRYARTHGPFTAEAAGAALGLPPAVIRGVLHELRRSGNLTRGAFRPGGEGHEWVDAGVLRRLKRRSLAVLRREIEAVEQPALGRFLPAWQGVGRTGRRHMAALVETIRTLQGVPVPASILERDVLTARLDYTPGMLDQLMASGEAVWIGRGPIGPRDGRVALYLRDQFPILHRPCEEELPDSALHGSIRDHLRDRGASFFRDLHTLAGGPRLEQTLEALWDLVWSGEVTNDTLAPLRALRLRRVRRRSGRARPHLPSTLPPSASGRWSLVRDLGGTPPTDAAWATAWTDLLLERQGVLTRAGALAEGIPGGLTTLYPVLNHMEETGRIRRGYFVEGMGGIQFALPGAIDRLRAEDHADGVVILAAADPANPYGSLLPWPEQSKGRASRSAGAYVILHEGLPLVYLERGGRKAALLDHDPDLHEAVAGALTEIGLRQRRLNIETIDGQPAGDHPLGQLLLRSGFAISLRGLAYRGS